MVLLMVHGKWDGLVSGCRAAAETGKSMAGALQEKFTCLTSKDATTKPRRGRWHAASILTALFFFTRKRREKKKHCHRRTRWWCRLDSGLGITSIDKATISNNRQHVRNAGQWQVHAHTSKWARKYNVLREHNVSFWETHTQVPRKKKHWEIKLAYKVPGRREQNRRVTDLTTICWGIVNPMCF